MNPLRLIIVLVSVFLFSYIAKDPTTVNKPGKKWVTLFNGKNLDHWKVKIAGYELGNNFGNTFRVENKILSTRYNDYDSFRNRFGALYYDKKFSNYRLKVEYRFVGELTRGAPSWGFRDGGINYHCQSPETVELNQPFPVCLEYNILGSSEKNERGTGEICASGMYVEINGKRNSSFCTAPFVKKSFNGDEWVTAEIEVRNGKITQFVNGVPVINFENPRLDSAHKITRQFITGANNTVRDGYISLQSNSHPMDFRKIEIMEY